MEHGVILTNAITTAVGQSRCNFNRNRGREVTLNDWELKVPVIPRIRA